MEIIRGRLSSAPLQPTNVRYDDACECVQKTNDGGVTWADDPASDPRHGVGFLKPPITGSNINCDSAANQVKWLKDFIDGAITILGTGTTALILVNTLLDFLDLLAPYAVLLTLISEAAESLFALGDAALIAAFTPDQYDLLLCIFACNADANGLVTPTGLGHIEALITDQLNTTAALVTNLILAVQGEIGLTNAGRIGTETGDCSSCTCEYCYTWHFDIAPGDWGVITTGRGTWGADPDTGLICWYALKSGGGAYLEIEYIFDAPTRLTHLEAQFNMDSHTATGSGTWLEIRGAFTTIVVPPGLDNRDGTNLAIAWDGDQAGVTSIAYRSQINAPDPTFTEELLDVNIKGVGENPVDTDNC